MSNMKIVSMIDSQVNASRTSVQAALDRLSQDLTHELRALRARIDRLRVDVDKLMQQEGEPPASSA